jgi:hypothetical protein
MAVHIIKNSPLFGGLLSLLCFGACGVFKKSECLAPGPTVQWEYDNCLIGAETDDALDPGVVACAELAGPAIGQNCARNMELKEKRCRFLVEKQSYFGDLQSCLHDPSVAGAVVKAGGIGG